MHKSACFALLFVSCFLALVQTGCGSDEDPSACDDAWKTWCACPMVSCDGHPTSCTGPDKTWADCINAAADACSATCD
jgi:hypothetical protein